MTLKNHAGLVLAAGASSRMGQPKALLPYLDLPLAVYQADVLKQAGCDPVLVVIGREAKRIGPFMAPHPFVVNEHWRKGRTSSVQTGLKALSSYFGCLVLPVDTVGVAVNTIAKTLRVAERQDAHVVRPIWRGERGRLVWISKPIAEEILRWDNPNEQTRLDQFLDPMTITFETEDGAAINNVNTMEEWTKLLGSLE